MSAIIAGECCAECGQSYYYSLGHQPWYDNVVKRGMAPDDDFKLFERIRRSGWCLECYVAAWRADKLPEFLLED